MLKAGGNATVDFVLGAEEAWWDVGEVPPSRSLICRLLIWRIRRRGLLCRCRICCLIGSFPSLYQSPSDIGQYTPAKIVL